MYLSDVDLHALLERMKVVTDNDDQPFDESAQVQPSSIDLRLSNVFWRPSYRARVRRRFGRRKPFDLRRSHLEELQPRRDWKKFSLDKGQSVTINPGNILMARIYERFHLPPEYAGKIEGRSSFARLGLMVHCTGDFINPGWSGYMPLQLYNAGPFALRIYPYLPICQLMIVPLSSAPTRTYGDPGLESKYENDDGGPSYWWRDKRIARLQKQLASANLSLQLRDDLVRLIRFQDPDLLEHFENFILGRKEGELENAEAILEAFGAREERRRWIDRIGKGAFPALVLASIGAAVSPPIGLWHVLLWIVSGLSVIWWWIAWFWHPAEYLGRKEIALARESAQREEEARKALLESGHA